MLGTKSRMAAHDTPLLEDADAGKFPDCFVRSPSPSLAKRRAGFERSTELGAGDLDELLRLHVKEAVRSKSHKSGLRPASYKK